MKHTLWVVLAVALIVGGFLLYKHFKQLKIAELEQKLQERIYDETDGYYKLTWDNLEVDEVRKRLLFRDLRLVTDSSFNNGATTKAGRSLPFIVLHIPTLEINGYKIDKKEKTIEVDEIKLLKANLVLSVDRSEQDSTGNWRREMNEQLLRKWDEVKIHRIQLENVSAKLIRKNLDTPQVEVKQASIDLRQLFLNKNVADTASVIDSFAISIFKAKELGWFDKRRFFKYTLNDINFNEADAYLLISRFKAHPQLSKQLFMAHIPYRKNYLTAEWSNIHFRGFQLSFDPSMQIKADNLAIGRSVISIERDHRLSHDGKNRVGSYPHQQLMRIPFLLYMKTIQFNDFDLTYKEVNEKTKLQGEMHFSKIAATINNLTNDKKQLAKQNRMNLVVNCFFEKRIPVKLNAAFILGHPTGAFQLNGQVGPLNLVDVNKVAMPIGSLRFETGKITKYDFNLKGSDQGANGEYRFLYNDLAIAAIDPTKDEGAGDKNHIKSLLFNIKLKNANPGMDGKLRSPTIFTKRVPDRSILHLVWHSLLDGMIQTAMPSAKGK
jgi:hypothetical protein